MIETQVGSYRIIEKLAHGGMGEVYVAYHDLMQREAVVKLIHPKFLHDEDVVQRFLNEARAATAIQHPGIVEIYDLGRSQGQVYIIMERLRGETLASRVDKGSLTIEETIALSKQFAGALSAAHAHDIVHRDLKPENLFVTPDPDIPGGERIKILDFGAAKLAPKQGNASMTAQGMIFGTPAYMAPEQCENAAAVDARSDLYAFGCIMYEMLCGQPPFGHGGLELFAAHLRDEAPPLTELNASVPDDIQRIVLKLLRKEPDERFQDCDELLQALESLDFKLGVPVPRASIRTSGLVKRLSALELANTVAPGEHDTDASAQSGGNAGAGESSDSQVPGRRTATTSPTTHRSATGEVVSIEEDAADADADEDKDEPAKRRLGWLAALALVLVVGGGVAFKMVSDQRAANSLAAADRELAVESVPPPPVTPPEPTIEPGREFLQQGELALADLRWEDAILAARQAVDLAEEGSSIRTRGKEIQETARQGQQYAWAYQVFNDAVAKGDIRSAVYSYEQLPKGSIYRERAGTAYQAMRDAWLAPHLGRATALAGKRRCGQIDEVTLEVRFMFPELAERISDIASECRRTGREANAQVKASEQEPQELDPIDEKKLPNEVPDFLFRQQLASNKTRMTACAIENPIPKPADATIEIAPTGEVVSFTLEGHDELRACLWLEIRQMKFGRARGPTTKTIKVGKKLKERRDNQEPKSKKST